MKNILSAFLLVITFSAFAQEKAVVSGKVSDKEMDNESLPFANVFVKGTTVGTTTDFDGNYTLSVNEGPATLVFSFVGYATIEVPMSFEAGQNYTISKVLGASEGITMDEVVVKAVVSREKETALLAEQKKAVVIKESIGAQQLAKVGVSNAAGATSKISGVTKSESSSSVYVRGLGDRYLSTTMNGLPIPSDDVSNKNINLNLFSTSLIQNVSVSKTYNPSSYSDQAAGNVDIASKGYTGDKLNFSFRTGSNTNLIGTDFRVSENNNDITAGFYSKNISLEKSVNEQGWDTNKKVILPNFSFSLSGGKKFYFEGDSSLSLFGSLGQSYSNSYRKGLFQSLNDNTWSNVFDDTELFNQKNNTTGLLDLGYSFAPGHSISFNTVFINKVSDNLYEQGRSGDGYKRDQEPYEYSVFIRDQNIKHTSMLVNQLTGKHLLSDTNKLTWAFGYSKVKAEEPNRIRTEVSILPDFVQLASQGISQKSSQNVLDDELNGFVKDVLTFDNGDSDPYKLSFGVNFRSKKRDFLSEFIMFDTNTAKIDAISNIRVPSIDLISNAFIGSPNDFWTASPKDQYTASLNVVAGYFDFYFVKGDFSGSLGARYEFSQTDLEWDIATFTDPETTLSNKYLNLFPSLSLKYKINETNFIRLASSITNTLPEFKELAPFNYTTVNGRVTAGNPNLERSENYNLDLKWEMFPENGGIYSITSFYKKILNPINVARLLGAAGFFSYDNTGKEADVYGFEFESRFDVLKTDSYKFGLNLNASKMWLTQDLLPQFQYNGKTNVRLQGASDFIVNSSFNFSTLEDKKFNAALSLNYASDKVLTQGAPTNFLNSMIEYNDEIIEKGFVTLDLVLSKEITEKLSLKLSGMNLLNPSIDQTQMFLNNEFSLSNQLVSSYRNGSSFNLSLNYRF